MADIAENNALEAAPAVLYAAKSTEDKRKSIPDQHVDCRAKAEREGWHIAGEFSDEGFSAYSGNRGPGLEAAKAAAVDAAMEHGSALLVAQHSDRVARGAGDAPEASDHLVEVVSWLTRHKIVLRTVQDDYYRDPKTAHLMAAVMGQRNTEDSRRKSESVAGGMRRRAQRGLFNGRFPPYGYRRVDGLLIVIASEAEVVRRIYREYVAGRSQQAIARDLNRDGVPTQQGRQWYQGSIRAILVNPVHRGKVTHLADQYDGVHEPIVDADLWFKARRLREANARTTGHGRGRKPKGRHLFIKGHLKCGSCGSSMLAVTKPNRSGGTYEVYACDGRKRNGPDYCPVGPVARAPVDGAAFTVWGTTQPELRRMEAELLERIEGERTHVMAERERAEREQLQADAAYTRVLDHYQQGLIEPEDWTEQRPGLLEACAGARARVERLKAREAEVVADGAMVADAGTQMARNLVSIMTTIFGEYVDPDALDEARASVRRILDECVLQPVPQDELDSWSGGGITLADDPADPPSGLNGTFALIPKLNEAVLEDWMASAREVDSRAEKYLGENEAKGLHT
jgi:DNA invertase Pin-like site-specific DNA recombinase